MPYTRNAQSVEVLPEARSPAQALRLRHLELVLLLLAAVFLVLHFLHLRADFPNFSPWHDWAKFTDEGWYGDAAIRHHLQGRWHVPGDFNPAAALPVWPALELILFHFTGVSLIAARALTVSVFALVLLAAYRLLSRWTQTGSLAPAAVVLLLAVNPFCFAFFRMAILEPLMVLLTLAALLAATDAGEAEQPLRGSLLLGVLLPLLVLTKTTAVFLFPSIFWMLFGACRYRVKPFLLRAVPASALGAAAWCSYYFGFVRPRYLTDYRYLFAANTYTVFKWSKAGDLLFDTLFDGIWIGKTLFALALFAMIGAIVGLCSRTFRRNPLPGTMLLWIFGYGAFLAYHANLQPRYYLVVAVPLIALVALVFEPLLRSAFARGSANAAMVDTLLLRLAAIAVAGTLGFACLHAGWQTVGFVLHPEYTWVNAAARIREAIDREAAAHPGHSRLLLSISGSDISLITGVPSICDDFGSMELSDRVAAYKPGWFATWNEVEDDKMEALAPRYTLHRTLTVPAFDDPDRNVVILYRLDPAENPGPLPRTRHPGVFAPKSLRGTHAPLSTPRAAKL